MKLSVFGAFFSKDSRIAGLSITEESVGFLLLTRKAKKTTAAHFKEQGIAEGAIQNGSIKNKELLGAVIKQVLPSQFLTDWREPRKVVVSIPESVVHYTDFLVSMALGRQRLEDSVISHLEQYSPLPLEKLYYDWEEYPLSEKQKVVFIAFAERTIVNAYLEIIRHAGCHPLAIEGEFLSIRRILSLDAHTVRLFLLAGPRRLNILILKNSSVSFSRSLAWNGNITELEKELTKIVEYYLTEYPESPPIKQLVITSSPHTKGLIPNIKTFIETNFKIETRESPVSSETHASGILEGVARRGLLPQSKDVSISLMVPGTEELFREARLLLFSKIINDFMIIVSVILVLVFSGVSFYLLPTYEKQKEDQIARKRAQPSLQEITELEAHITDFNNFVEPLAAIEQSAPDWIIPLTDIVIRTREGIHIKDISMDAGSKTVTVSGTADDIGFLLDFKSALSFSGIYGGDLAIPFSSFEKEADIPFSYTLAFKNLSILYPSNPQKQLPSTPLL